MAPGIESDAGTWDGTGGSLYLLLLVEGTGQRVLCDAVCRGVWLQLAVSGLP